MELAIYGWNAFAGFIPSKQIGIVALCSCDPTDADMSSLGFVLLHLTRAEDLTAKTELNSYIQPQVLVRKVQRYWCDIITLFVMDLVKVKITRQRFRTLINP